MDRARPHDHEQAPIAVLQNRPHGLPGFQHRLRRFGGQGQKPLDLFGRRQQIAGDDVDVLQLLLKSRHYLAYIDVRMVQSSGKNFSSNALVKYETPPVPPVPRL